MNLVVARQMELWPGTPFVRSRLEQSLWGRPNPAGTETRWEKANRGRNQEVNHPAAG